MQMSWLTPGHLDSQLCSLLTFTGGSLILSGTNYIFLAAPSDFNYLAAAPGQVASFNCQHPLKHLRYHAAKGIITIPAAVPLHPAWGAELVAGHVQS
jgi:hypothetical protein